MTGKITDLLVQSKSTSHGLSLAGLEAEDVDEVEASTLVSLIQKVTNLTNDHFCITPPIPCQVLVEEKSDQTVQQLVQDSLSCQNVVKLLSLSTAQRHSNQTVFCHVNHVQSAISKGLSQKKGVRPDVTKTEIKHLKDVSFVNPCLSARSVPNVPNVVKELGVGGRLKKFWPKLEALGANPRVVSILREGYTLPFKMRPPLTRFPLVRSGYANPARSRALLEALGALIEKLVGEKWLYRPPCPFTTACSWSQSPTTSGAQSWTSVNSIFFSKQTPSRWKPRRPSGSLYKKESGSRRWISATLTFISLSIPDPENTSGSF